MFVRRRSYIFVAGVAMALVLFRGGSWLGIAMGGGGVIDVDIARQ